MSYVSTTEVAPTASNVDGDHDRFSHYVEKGELMKALVEGIPVIALCGKIWVPSRDPDKYPVCPSCKEIYDKLLSQLG